MKNIPYELADKIEVEFGKLRKTNDYWYNTIKKDIDDAVELSDGRIVLFDKPRIEKSFYFIYSDLYPQIGTLEQARADAERMKTDEQFFVERNMEEFSSAYNRLKKGENFWLLCNLWNQSDSKIRIVSFYPYGFKLYEPGTEDERKILLECYEKQKVRFEKRLRTYLKRYGLTKVQAHVTWAD